MAEKEVFEIKFDDASVNADAEKISDSREKSNKGKKKNNKDKKLQLKIRKTMQQSIPYEKVYKECGIIEIEPGVYSRQYHINDINFKTATEQEQQQIYERYSSFLNSFDPSITLQICINNRSIDKKEFKKSVMIKPQKDGLNEYREEYNKMLESKIEYGGNSVKSEKYLVVSIREPNGIDAAIDKFNSLNSSILESLSKITDSRAEPFDINERLNVIYEIFNMGQEGQFLKKANVDGHEVATFDLSSLSKMGLNTKDIVGPNYFEFKKDYFVMGTDGGDTYARVIFLEGYPSYMTTEFLTSLNEVPCNLLTSVTMRQVPQDKALSMVRNQMVNINANIIDAQKKAAKSGYSGELISPELKNSQDECNTLLNDLRSRDQKMFLTSVTVMVMANSLEKLNDYTSIVMTNSKRFMCTFKYLSWQQEQGLANSLPLGHDKLAVNRMLTTESAGVLLPFSSEEVNHPNGFYYGMNAVTNNLIIYDRFSSKNYNGMILGTPGSGKSFSAKREMLNVMLNTNDDIIILDPEREYAPMVELLGGATVKISPGSKVHINPFDMDIDYADAEDPVTLKSDYISSLCNTIVGSKYGLSPIERSIIDRCIRKLYQNYLTACSEKGQKSMPELVPTLKQFYNMLLDMPEQEANNLALSLELYSVGSLNTFAYRSNIAVDNRFLVYDIKDIGSGMKELGLQVCLNDAWNRIISNRRKGKKTWLYMDEFYLLTQSEDSAKFLMQIWKRARKWGGVPTGITQNVEDLLQSQYGRTIISNCDFVLLLNQAHIDLLELSELLHISENQRKYVTNSNPGEGLIYTGRTIVPFIDKFPTNTKLYQAMSTKPKEDNKQ